MNETLLWQTSQNGSTWMDMKTPSVFDYDWEDADDNSYRSVISANLIRERIVNHLYKLQLEYRHISASEVNTLARAVNTLDKFWVRCKAPAFGNMQNPGTGATNDWVQFKAYTSKFSVKTVKRGDGSLVYNMNFNIIQSDVGTFNNA